MMLQFEVVRWHGQQTLLLCSAEHPYSFLWGFKRIAKVLQ